MLRKRSGSPIVGNVCYDIVKVKRILETRLYEIDNYVGAINFTKQSSYVNAVPNYHSRELSVALKHIDESTGCLKYRFLSG